MRRASHLETDWMQDHVKLGGRILVLRKRVCDVVPVSLEESVRRNRTNATLIAAQTSGLDRISYHTIGSDVRVVGYVGEKPVLYISTGMQMIGSKENREKYCGFVSVYSPRSYHRKETGARISES